MENESKVRMPLRNLVLGTPQLQLRYMAGRSVYRSKCDFITITVGVTAPPKADTKVTYNELGKPYVLLLRNLE
jgi:hypothetical protein